ncbi:MFS transporter, DHA1 family, bicyclomycin/chloramphenicol resistance protein [Sporobacter termitidis DSM 10068]|uniref:Bcr/CflA family efflux transporter n=1 Tax=Sporobacter termitidis DSM 10068 TaxID=1123282 RepID=A0A1M5YFZ2_9FIRM|nr:Bcr/CflA family efflux MFS transporter [Sporobacter termitidis]SHI10955.1 MFS transporter, DHA1 family, bicyclomycin/chloramphenicol resistance protein [Sporobacter termitidis DSM 10068]
MDNSPEKPELSQKYLGGKGLIIFVVLLSAFAPLSTDLYLPALPSMTEYFHVSSVLTNMTIILFLVFYSLSMLVWGPFSDKYGRKPILLSGLLGYTAAGVLCAVSDSVYMLIVFRVLQATCAGAASATSAAILKDVYEGPRLEKTLAVVQTIFVVCPVIAPMLGGQILRFTDWRGTFYAQTILGVVVTILALLYTETIRDRITGNIFRTLGRLGVVLKNKRFTVLLLIFATSGITFLAFVTSSAYIYEDYFGQSSQMYSYFFAFNSVTMILGPFLYVRLSSRFSRFSLINACFAVSVAAGILVICVGRLNPYAFALTMMPATVMGSFVGPPSRFLLMTQQQGDTGSVSSLINAIFTLTGSIGMLITSLNLGNLVVVIGALFVLMNLLCGAAWLFFTSRPFMRDLRG